MFGRMYCNLFLYKGGYCLSFDLSSSMPDLNSEIFSAGTSFRSSLRLRTSAGLSFWRGWDSGRGMDLSGVHSKKSLGVQERMEQSLLRFSSLRAEVLSLIMLYAIDFEKPFCSRYFPGFVMPRRRKTLIKFIFSIVILVYISNNLYNMGIYLDYLKEKLDYIGNNLDYR